MPNIFEQHVSAKSENNSEELLRELEIYMKYFILDSNERREIRQTTDSRTGLLSTLPRPFGSNLLKIMRESIKLQYSRNNLGSSC